MSGGNDDDNDDTIIILLDQLYSTYDRSSVIEIEKLNESFVELIEIQIKNMLFTTLRTKSRGKRQREQKKQCSLDCSVPIASILNKIPKDTY